MVAHLGLHLLGLSYHFGAKLLSLPLQDLQHGFLHFGKLFLGLAAFGTNSAIHDFLVVTELDLEVVGGGLQVGVLVLGFLELNLLGEECIL